MRTLMVCRWIGWAALAGLMSPGIAGAYTRVYLTNDTGARAFSLHVKLTQPASQGSALAGFPAPLFQQARVLEGGMELDFSLPLDPIGIADGAQVPVGWVDLDLQSTASVEWFYWSDASGNRIGQVQRLSTPPEVGQGGPTAPPTVGGLLLPGGESGSGGNQELPPGDLNDLAGGTSGDLPPALMDTAAPEPGTMALLTAAMLLAVCRRLRPTPR